MKRRIIQVILIFLCVVSSLWFYQRAAWIHKGGPMMIPILWSSYFSFALMAAKIKQFARLNFDMEDFLKNIFEFLNRQRIKESIDFCDKVDHPMARILKAGIMKYDRPKDEIKEAMEDSFLFEIPELEDKLPILSALIQVVPLFGFLGTLIGLTNIFSVMEAKKMATLAVSLLDFSSGIWQAMICPMAGFLVTIPVLLVYNYFTNRIRTFTQEAEKGSTELLEFFMERRTAP